MTLQDDVQAILDRGVAAGDVVGAVARVVTGDGLLAAAAAGERSADAQAGAGPMTLDTVCWIASMTKAVTGTAAMQLVERGELHLDEPASSVLPNLGASGWSGSRSRRARARASTAIPRSVPVRPRRTAPPVRPGRFAMTRCARATARWRRR